MKILLTINNEHFVLPHCTNFNAIIEAFQSARRVKYNWARKDEEPRYEVKEDGVQFQIEFVERKDIKYPEIKLKAETLGSLCETSQEACKAPLQCEDAAKAVDTNKNDIAF